MKNIYLAGPDVFLKNAAEVFAKKKRICKKYGFIGHAPLDNNINLPDDMPLFDRGMKIYFADIAMMDTCDIIVANMTPFQGISMDVGTAYEMGYMRAQGKIIYAYSNHPTPFIDRQCAVFEYYTDTDDNILRDTTTKMRCLNTDMSDNLMVIGPVVETTENPPLVAQDHITDPIIMHTRTDVFERTIQALHQKYGYI